jgi:hypothetical protein
MLLDGLPYPQIIQNLGDDGKDLNEENIGTWRAGGYQDWLRQQIRIEEQQTKFEMALDMARDNAGTTFQRVGRQIAAAQLCDLFLDFDPAIVSQALVGKPELYIRLINTLARLSEGETSATYRQTQEAHLKARLQQHLPENAPKAVTQETLLNIAKELRLLPNRTKPD